jgi:hypothetical protein
MTPRKERLYACACVRQVWHLLTDPRSRNAVEVAERLADGQATAEAMAQARAAAQAAREAVSGTWAAAEAAARDAGWAAWAKASAAWVAAEAAREAKAKQLLLLGRRGGDIARPTGGQRGRLLVATGVGRRSEPVRKSGLLKR